MEKKHSVIVRYKNLITRAVDEELIEIQLTQYTSSDDDVFLREQAMIDAKNTFNMLMSNKGKQEGVHYIILN